MNYDVDTLSVTDLAAGAKATFTVRPKAGLAVGTYNETITINGTNGAKATVDAEFAVTEPPAITMTTAAGEVNLRLAGSGGATIDWGDGSAPEAPLYRVADS